MKKQSVFKEMAGSVETEKEAKTAGKQKSKPSPKHARIEEAHNGFILHLGGGDTHEDRMLMSYEQGKPHVHESMDGVIEATKKHFGVAEKVKSGTESEG